MLRIQATLALQKRDNVEMPSATVFAGPVIPPVGKLPGVFPVRPVLLTGHGFGIVFLAPLPVFYHPHEDPGDPDEPENDRADNVEETQHRGHQHRDEQDPKLPRGRQKIPEVPWVLSLFVARVVVALGVRVVILVLVFLPLLCEHTTGEIEKE